MGRMTSGEKPMQLIRINDRLSIAPQPDTGEFGDLRKQGFAALINARPDGEDADQPGTAAEEAAAKAAGLSYDFVPVTLRNITEADIRAFRDAMARADGPVLAHCKSGVRALTLQVIGDVLDGRLALAEIPILGRRHGFDLGPASAWLEKHFARRPHVRAFFESRSSSIQYVASDPATGKCAIIDPVLNFDEKSGAISTRSADEMLDFIAANGLELEWILDTHPHADHFSAAHYLKGRTGAPTAIGDRIGKVQEIWKQIYNWPELATDGSQWDHLFADGETFRLGSIDGRIMFSPGHTLASITYVIGDAAFVHDTLFMPDGGTARADFPGGSAAMLWNSIQSILALPGDTRLFTGHDYQPGGRHARWESTVLEQRQNNPHLALSEQEFIQRRSERDKTLPMPSLILHALQVNIRGGRLPEPEENGRRYLKFPLDAL